MTNAYDVAETFIWLCIAVAAAITYLRQREHASTELADDVASLTKDVEALRKDLGVATDKLEKYLESRM